MLRRRNIFLKDAAFHSADFSIRVSDFMFGLFLFKQVYLLESQVLVDQNDLYPAFRECFFRNSPGIADAVGTFTLITVGCSGTGHFFA